ncbi:MAG: aminotransferase class V-fold PLP-dependent enzyme [Acidobacteriota bacterium]|nr:aminotransferase class V-fold PLP-dependent enzyme [Acidobacteriota bacterium]
MPPDSELCKRFRPELTVTRAWNYLNHAAISPISRRVLSAMTGLLEDVCLNGADQYERWLSATDTARRAAASLINAEPDEIAFLKNTSEGISAFALGLEWKKGDEVVSIEGEFPANYYAWKLLERRGVRVRFVEQPGGEISLDSIERAINRRTKVVAVSFVQFLSGYRLDLVKLGRICADRKVLLFVDAIQGLGAFPVDVKDARIAGLAACGHKWLLGPEGCALFFARRDVLERLAPCTAGWMSVEGWEDFVPREITWRKDGGRFEGGAANRAGIYGLHTAISLILEAGPSRIASRVLDLTDRLRAGLLQRGFQIYGPKTREHGSGIVSFLPLKGSAEDARLLLNTHHIAVSARRGMIRISPHFYNTEEEIDRALELLT